VKRNVVLLGSSSGVAQDGRAAVHPPQPEVFVAEIHPLLLGGVRLDLLLATCGRPQHSYPRSFRLTIGCSRSTKRPIAVRLPCEEA